MMYCIYCLDNDNSFSLRESLYPAHREYLGDSILKGVNRVIARLAIC